MSDLNTVVQSISQYNNMLAVYYYQWAATGCYLDHAKPNASLQENAIFDGLVWAESWAQALASSTDIDPDIPDSNANLYL